MKSRNLKLWDWGGSVSEFSPSCDLLKGRVAPQLGYSYSHRGIWQHKILILTGVEKGQGSLLV